jgi:hypothetical protein
LSVLRVSSGDVAFAIEGYDSNGGLVADVRASKIQSVLIAAWVGTGYRPAPLIKVPSVSWNEYFPFKLASLGAAAKVAETAPSKRQMANRIFFTKFS